MKPVTKKIMIAVSLILFLFCAYHAAQIVRWKMHIWLPDYISQVFKGKPAVSGPRHVMFLFVDHYEPGLNEKGVALNNQWLNNYRELAGRHKDSYGRKPQHTWFYAYDHKNDGVMPDLARAVYEGYGEIEFHWHHDNDTNQTFPAKLAEGVAWFNRYGALVDGNGTVAFSFIHGNWSLDNSRGKTACGVNRELDILKGAGCYADFTFPSFGQVSQPAQINSIYYAADDDGPKSYNRGVPAAVGKKNSKDLMIFEGPLTLVDYGAFELDPYPSRRKVDSWIDANIHVQGRPEWIFIKVFTHGVQSRKVIFSPIADEMFSALEQKYAQGDYRLHYVTAREAYNIVRAAEDGKSGDPDQYRDYEIKPPLNKIKPLSLP